MHLRLVVIVLAAIFAAVAAGLIARSASARSDATAAVTVTVTATEFRYRLSKRAFRRGSIVAFKLINRGEDVHDFKVKGFKRKTPVIQPGSQYTLRLTFKKAGRYTYLCTVPRHAQLGMSGTLVIR